MIFVFFLIQWILSIFFNTVYSIIYIPITENYFTHFFLWFIMCFFHYWWCKHIKKHISLNSHLGDSEILKDSGILIIIWVDKILRCLSAFLGVSEDYAATSGEDQVVKVPEIFVVARPPKIPLKRGGCPICCFFLLLGGDWNMTG